MPRPSQLAIATGMVTRLVKESKMREEELKTQESHVEKLQDDFDKDGNSKDENAEYMLNQEKHALQEAKNVLPVLKTKIEEAADKLKAEITTAEGTGSEEELKKAKDAMADAEPFLTASPKFPGD